MEINDVLEADDLAEGLILACQSRPVTDSVEVSYDDDSRVSTRRRTSGKALSGAGRAVARRPW